MLSLNFIFLYSSCLLGFPTANFVHVFFLLHWQSKYKEDTSATCPILLDEPEFEVHSFPFLYLCMHPHSLSLSHVIIYCLSSFFFLFFFFFFACLFISFPTLTFFP